MEERIGRRLSLTAKALQEHFDQRLAQVGGSLPSWIALSILSTGDGISQRQLAELMHVEGPTLTHHLDRWSAEGLIERRRDADDRRVVRVRLTSAGRRRHRAMSVVAEAEDARLRALMSPTELRTLEAVLDRVRRSITTSEEGHVHQAG